MASSVDVVIKLLGDSKGFQGAMRNAQRSAATTGQRMKAVGAAMQGAGRQMTMGFTVPVIAGLALATKAAAAEEKEMALLSKAIKNNTKETDKQIAAVEEWITAQQNATGIADGELRPALAALVAVTKDTGKAQKLLGIAMDIAVAKGKPVVTIAEALAKAQNGNIGILSRYGIATRNAAGETLTFDQIMQNAVKTFGGSAATAAKTTSGKMAILQAQLADMAENIGNAVLPVVSKLVGLLAGFFTALNKMPAPVRNFIVGLGLVVAAAGPVLWIIGSVIKNVSAMKAAYDGFRAAQAAGKFTTISNAIGGVNTRLRNQPGLFKSAGASMGAYVASIALVTIAVWQTVEAIQGWREAEANLAAMRKANLAQEQGALDRIAAKYGRNSKQYRKMVKNINDANAAMVADQEKQLTGLADWLDSWAQGLNDAWWVGGPAKFLLQGVAKTTSVVADWAGLASGGYVAPRVGGTPTILGEGGEGEYVIPASKMGSRMGGTVHVHIGTLVGTDERAARQLADMVGRHLMRGVMRGMVGQNA